MARFEAQLARELPGLLAEWLGWPDVEVRQEVQLGKRERADLMVELNGIRLVVECKGIADSAAVNQAASHARAVAKAAGRSAVPIVAVPYMGEAGRAVCEKAGVGWLDLSGNAHIAAKGLHVHVEGKPNRFKRAGRPSTVFAPRSSRIVRQLLIDPVRAWSQHELAVAAGLNEGFTSRIVRKLEADGHVGRDEHGPLRLRDPDLLLDSWRETYAFRKHDVIEAHLTARSGEELLSKLAEGLVRRKVSFAATGLAAAWLMDKFAAFRLATVYLRERLPEKLLRELAIREEARGANLWLVTPNDDGVFTGAEVHEGIACAHAVQVYLDLKAHPERAGEAAAELRKRRLRWRER
jgi:hypothetical protein